MVEIRESNKHIRTPGASWQIRIYLIITDSPKRS